MIINEFDDITAADLVHYYITMRDNLAKETKAFSERCQELYREPMERIEAKLLEKLNAAGGESLKTRNGTVYKSRIVQPKVVDRDKYLDAVMENYSTWGAGMLQLREPKKEAVDDFMAGNQGFLPPGVEITSFQRVNIRKA